jgi:predicted SAM-dependent methyltransferase
MSRYLIDKGPHSVYRIHDASVSMVESNSIDAVVAHGVFEHLDLDVAFWFLVDFLRVLRSGGTVAFNFDNACSAGGTAHLRTSSSGDRPSLFRFHAPDAIRSVAAAAGYVQTTILEDSHRIAFASCRK